MNPSPEFSGIELENSILCKHRKIAGRVETIFREAAPIRLNEIARLKRLGPEPISFDRCPECRQYVCNCLWKKHIHVRSNEKVNAGNCNAAGVSKVECRSKVNVMPFKVRKWNSNYGNTFSTQMSWVKKPINKMSFSDEHSIKREGRQTLESNASTFQNASSNLQVPGKIDNDYLKSHKDNFEKRRRKLAEKKSNQNVARSVRKSKTGAISKTSKQNQMLDPQPAAKYIKNFREYSTPKQHLPMQLNMMMTAAPIQIPPSSPQVMPRNAETGQCSCHSSVISNPRVNRLTQVSDAFNYPSRFNLWKPEGICRRKASEFLLKYKEAGVSRPACTIGSLENIEHKAKIQTLKSSKTNAEKSIAFYGDLQLLDQSIHHRIDFREASGINTTPRKKCDRGENKKYMKHIGVQTEESSFFIQAQTSSISDSVATDTDADEVDDDEMKTFQLTAVVSSLLPMERNFGEALVQELVCQLTDEVPKCNSRIKKLTALFESRSKVNSTICSRQSLSLLNIYDCKKNINLNHENTKSFCSAAEFPKGIKNQIVDHSDNKITTKAQTSDDANNDDFCDSISSSKSCSEISITTVVVNPLKKDRTENMKSEVEFSCV